jgi:type III secretory pathway component EscS
MEVIMSQSKSSPNNPINRDAKLRLIVARMHSAPLLLPTVIIGIYVSIVDLPQTVSQRGWFWGPVVALGTIMGIVISLLDLAPRMAGWMLRLHRKLKRLVDVVGDRLKGAIARMKFILGNPYA